jgi:PGRS repeats
MKNSTKRHAAVTTNYIGRVGALATALGVGVAMASMLTASAQPPAQSGETAAAVAANPARPPQSPAASVVGSSGHLSYTPVGSSSLEMSAHGAATAVVGGSTAREAAPAVSSALSNHNAAASHRSGLFAPTTFAVQGPSSGGGPTALAVNNFGPTLSPSGAGLPGLFSPTGAFLGLIGPGGLLVGDGVLPGQNGGLLIGNGADGGPGQDGGRGGLLFGNGGRGGDGLAGQAGGNGGDAGLFGVGGTGGTGGYAAGDGNVTGGAGGQGTTASGTNGGDGADG